MLLPLSVMAMTPVSDSTLSDVTGQAGVNINADLTLNIDIGSMAWGDSSGVDANTGAGWSQAGSTGYVGVTGFNITNLRIKAREVADGKKAHSDLNTYATTGNTYTTYSLKPITIDVATSQQYSTLAGNTTATDVTFVRFGLGSLVISMNAMDFDIELGKVASALKDDGGQIMGKVGIGDMYIYINPASYVDIYAHKGCGVNLTMNVAIDSFELGYVSWGDTDGITTGYGSVGAETGGFNWIDEAADGDGFVGLADLKVGAILVKGTVAIDVATAGAGSVYYVAHSNTATPVVHISFPENFVIDVDGPITADVVVSDDISLNGTGAEYGVMGDIYIEQLKITVVKDSWVDIWAH